MWCLAVSTGLGDPHAVELVGCPSVLVGAREEGGWKVKYVQGCDGTHTYICIYVRTRGILWG